MDKSPLVVVFLAVSLGCAVLIITNVTPLPSLLRRRTVSDLLLVALGATTLLLYGLLFLARYPLYLYYDRRELLDLVKLAGPTTEAGSEFFTTFLVLFALYAMAVRLSAQVTGRAVGIALYIVPAVAALLLVYTYPVTAGDVYDYIISGRLLALYGQNPLVTPPETVQHDPLYRNTGWGWRPSPYGPVWALFAAALAGLSGDDLLVAMVAFKLSATLSLIGTAFVVSRIARSTIPGRELSAFCYVAWNPLLLFESAANAHNDFLMVLLTSLALHLLLSGRPTLALPTLALSALVKYVSLILFPAFVVYVLLEPARPCQALSTSTRSRAYRLPPGVILACLVLVSAYIPFWADGAAIDTVREHARLFTSSPGALLYYRLQAAGIAEEIARHWVTQWSRGATLVLWLLCLARLRHTPSSLVLATHEALFFYLSIGSVWFQPWYLAWIVPLAAVAAVPQHLRTLVFSYTAAMLHLVTGFGWRMGWGDGDLVALNAAAVLVVFAWPLVMWAGENVAGAVSLLRQKMVLSEARSAHPKSRGRSSST